MEYNLIKPTTLVQRRLQVRTNDVGEEFENLEHIGLTGTVGTDQYGEVTQR